MFILFPLVAAQRLCTEDAFCHILVYWLLIHFLVDRLYHRDLSKKSKTLCGHWKISALLPVSFDLCLFLMLMSINHKTFRFPRFFFDYYFSPYDCVFPTPHQFSHVEGFFCKTQSRNFHNTSSGPDSTPKQSFSRSLESHRTYEISPEKSGSRWLNWYGVGKKQSHTAHEWSWGGQSRRPRRFMECHQ